MRIKTNVPALNAHRRLGGNQSKLAKNLEKLSSGYKINRAADDAAGLAISEKMRAFITGMGQAELNTEDGIGLIRTGEGAMQEVHAMLNRLDELAVQSANGIYTDEENRAGMQEEADKIRDEVERIAKYTNFNNINLFQDEGLEAEGGTTAALLEAEASSSMKAGHEPSTLADVLADKGDTLNNIIYTETVFDFETEASPVDGTANTFNEEQKKIADTLQTSVVPQVVTAIMDKYKAFNYLTGSSIGIGLRLYEDPASSTLASVTVGYPKTGDADYLIYSLSVNTAKVGDLNDPAVRSSLEQTIAHEMIHAFMDEATTVGMTGQTPSGASNAEFPSWFVEGMAQTASGPGNWTRGGSLNLNTASTPSEITAALSGNNALGAKTSASEYGTGYLACMYLGYLAGGGTADMSDPAAAADAITKGLSDMLSKLIDGKSLQAVISETTKGTYTTIASFQNGFANDSNALAFVQGLLKYTSNPDPSANVGGGLLRGDLSNTDPVDDAALSGLKLFALDTGHTQIKNVYPPEITVLSGGGAEVEGVKPITPTTPVVYPTNVFTITGGAENTDWRFDTDTGTLHILTGTELAISGGTLTDASGTYYGNIVIEDNISAKLNLNGVAIDASKKENTAGILIGDGCNASISMTGTNTVIGGGNAAGIQLTGNSIYNKTTDEQKADHDKITASSVTIDMQTGSTLTATGGTTGRSGGAGIGAAWATDTSKSDITIKGTGIINAAGGMGGAGIGGSEGGSIGNISLSGTGLDVKAVGGDHGAGIGGGGWVAEYREPPDIQRVESITILGDVNVDASSKSHGTGIGSGCHGAVGTVTIGSVGGGNKPAIKTKGGNDGAAIGAGWAGTMDNITINSGDISAIAGTRGAGIGSGYEAAGGEIAISGGTVTAKGDTNASGIGGGMNGTISAIEISGGMITADGGWTNDGGNIGGYTDKDGTTKSTVTITDPSGLTIKAGEKGEGKYITTGSFDKDGNQLYALDMKYIGLLLQNKKIDPLEADGTDPTTLSYPLKSVKVEVVPGGSPSYSWTDLQHMSEGSAYIWAVGKDIKLTFEDQDGTKGTLNLKFFEDYGLWRMDADDLPPELPVEPGYVMPDPVRPSVTDPVIASGAIILQVGPNPEDIFLIPRFYFSRTALKLDEYDISTQVNARDSIGKVDKMIDRVSEIRGSYGAMDNALGHIVNNLKVGIENLSQAESRIRDADMAKEMMEYMKNNILVQSAQSMLAQANTLPQAVLSLLR